MYLSDDMSEQELRDAAAEQRLIAGSVKPAGFLSKLEADMLNGTDVVQRRESGLYVPRALASRFRIHS